MIITLRLELAKFRGKRDAVFPTWVNVTMEKGRGQQTDVKRKQKPEMKQQLQQEQPPAGNAALSSPSGRPPQGP